ncbi:hypothetical protein [Dysgonomonas mossii]
MRQRTKYILIVLFFIIALLITGTSDYNEAKETAEYWRVQTK